MSRQSEYEENQMGSWYKIWINLNESFVFAGAAGISFISHANRREVDFEERMLSYNVQSDLLYTLPTLKKR